MKILFDQGVPKPLRSHLATHDVQSAYQLGWAKKKNGELLASAEAAGFDLLVTTDQNLRYQQKFSSRKLSLFILGRGNWPEIAPYALQIAEEISGIRKVGVYFFAIPPVA